MIARHTIEKDEGDDGFSSEEDYRQQIILQHQRLETPSNFLDKEDARKMVQPPGQIKDKFYSLRPDIMTGWKPRFELPQPIPVRFSHNYFDQLTNYVLRNNADYPSVKLCYLGPRYETTFFAWYEKPFEFPYKHVNAPNNWKFTNRFFFGQHWDAEGKDFLQFDSLFESGNLDMAYRINQREYQLFMRVDSNTKGHLQWYNFKVRNMVKGESYRFYISNFQKAGILYTRGMTPYVFSQRRFEQRNRDWQQGCSEVRYSRKMPKISTICQYGQDTKYYRLSFTYECEYNDDTVQFAYCIPYPYSKVQEYIQNLQQLTKDMQILKVSKLCTSLGGLEIPLLTITNNISQEAQSRQSGVKLSGKRVIIASARTHPGEPNGSYMIEGFISWLCRNSTNADFLRSKVIFKIIPMLNVDGVSIGNYRTSLSGKDLNREFINPDRRIYPQIYYLKALVKEYRQLYRNRCETFFDFHGHSVKKNVFVYGPQFPIIEKNYYTCRIIPKLISMKTDMFRYYSCSFKVSEAKQSTARGVLLKQYGIPFTYTIEASKSSYFNRQDLKDVSFTCHLWKEMGEKIAEAVKDYVEITLEEEQMRLQKRQQRRLASEKKEQAKGVKYNKNVKFIKTKRNFLKTTSSSFYSSQKMIPTEEQSSPLLVSNSTQKKQFLQSIMNQIRAESKLKEQNHNCEDQISEGSSDCEPSEDDLDQEERNLLIEAIKNKQSALKKQRFDHRPKTQSELQIKHKPLKVKTETFIDDEQNLRVSMSRPISSIKNQNAKRFTFLKKKSFHTDFSFSPKKEDRGTPAKIVNFHFGITAVPQQRKPRVDILPKQKRVSDLKINQGSLSSGFIDYPEQRQKTNFIIRNSDYSETFKRAFLSIKKDSTKKQPSRIYTECSSDIQINAYKVQDVRGRKVKLVP